jgi:hypothetical protein
VSVICDWDEGVEISLFDRRRAAVRQELQSRQQEYRVFLAEWITSVRQGRSGDRAVVTEAVADLCRRYGANCPEIVWCRGPRQALSRIRALATSGSLGDNLFPPGLFQLGELSGGQVGDPVEGELFGATDETWMAAWNALRRESEGRSWPSRQIPRRRDNAFPR